MHNVILPLRVTLQPKDPHVRAVAADINNGLGVPDLDFKHTIDTAIDHSRLLQIVLTFSFRPPSVINESTLSDKQVCGEPSWTRGVGYLSCGDCSRGVLRCDSLCSAELGPAENYSIPCRIKARDLDISNIDHLLGQRSATFVT